jgi:DNA-binding response OmpR family regulator
MKKVLLVTSETQSLASYRNMLDREDLRILTAATYEEGLRIHREESVDLVITDLDLSGMGGDVLCCRIRQDESLKNVSIVVVCGDTPDEIERAETCGANERLLKPVEPEDLRDRVDKLIAVANRRDCHVLVRAQSYDGEYGTRTIFATSRNISVSGLLIESDGLLAVGDRISCMFFLPGEIKISGVGEVARVARLSRLTYQYGIRFVSIYPKEHAELQNFVAVNEAA